LQGKRLVFVTNNSTKSRKQYGKKFETLGLSVDEVVGFFSYRHELVLSSELLITSFFLLLTDEAGLLRRKRSSLHPSQLQPTCSPSISPRTRRYIASFQKEKNKTVTAVFHMISYELCQKYDIVSGVA
jgi:hypothetical protein